MFGKQSSIVIVFVDRNRLQFYGSGMPSILVLDIPPAIIKDLEVMSRDALYTLVKQWLKQNNVGTADLFVVLSPQTYFEKAITAASESEQETEILSFYDSVPFEDLLTKVMTLDNKKRAIATNRDFVEGIRHAFMLQGHHVLAVIPASPLGAIAAKRWLDAEMGSYILKHYDALRAQNIVDLEESEQPVSGPPSSVPTSKSSPQLMIMVGMLGVLLLVLIFLMFVRR